MSTTSILQRITFLLLLQASGCAYAIGDSAGGCERSDSPLGLAAIAGSPQELEVEIDKRINDATDLAKKNKKLLSHPNWANLSIWIASETISQPMRRKRSIFINWWSGCQNSRLLELAAAGGNHDVAQYLLDLGADPNILDHKGSYGGNSIFMRCSNLVGNDRKQLSAIGVPDPTRTKAEINRKIAVYSLLILRGGDLRRTNKDGLSALHLCKDPALIKLYLKNGANPNLPVEKNWEKRQNADALARIPVLDFRIERILKDYEWEREANFSVLQQLLPLIKNRKLEQETEWRICFECANPGKSESCRRLSKMISVPDRDIFSSDALGNLQEVAHDKCRKYSPYWSVRSGVAGGPRPK